MPAEADYETMEAEWLARQLAYHREALQTAREEVEELRDKVCDAEAERAQWLKEQTSLRAQLAELTRRGEVKKKERVALQGRIDALELKCGLALQQIRRKVEFNADVDWEWVLVELTRKEGE